MPADTPAIAYRASWRDFLNAELAADLKIDFFTSSCLGFSSPERKGAGSIHQTQAGMLTSPRDSAGIGLVCAAALLESETTQLPPANALQIALPAQLK